MHRRRLVVKGATIRLRPAVYKGRIAVELQKRTGPLLSSGQIAVPLQGGLPLKRAVDAHRILDENRQMGKIILFP